MDEVRVTNGSVKNGKPLEGYVDVRRYRTNYKIAFFHLLLHIAFVYGIFLIFTENISIWTYCWSELKRL